MSKSRLVTRLLVVAIVALAAMLPVELAASAGIVEQAQIQYDKGSVLIQQGKLTDAATELRKVDTNFSEDATADPHLKMLKALALAGVADILRMQDKPDEAIAVASDSLTRFSQFRSPSLDATIVIAKCYQAKGDYVRAISYFKDVLKLYPEKISRADLAYARLTDIQDKHKPILSSSLKADIDDAVATYQRARAEEDAVTAARRAALAKFASGDAKGAKADLLAQFANPAALAYHGRVTSLGWSQVSVGDRLNARTTFQRALTLGSDEFTPEGYKCFRLQVFYGLEDLSTVIAEAKDDLATYPDGTASCEMRYYLARSYDRTGQVAECLDAFGDMIARYGSSTDWDTRMMIATTLTRSGCRLRELGKKTEAEEMFRRASADYSDSDMGKAAGNMLKDMEKGGNQ